ncbi:uncharacterized protein BT62DRAFT_631355 [Guyanagaster necrorhizus]|uniref:Uncharacterized protein n=1 Tax=Guyanagaster necrorhizus TaxID=856835 RepID=A0A9P7VGE1_9AGAR|nr:uncharacterized protein BT62DRAFT_631355 [Guyanagaster necrorhizus MCA 3950]KAG7440229.1 hypothetical protein BT62DRAFT_631355 [Guyanagaster necrorhizus MCA 3950]
MAALFLLPIAPRSTHECMSPFPLCLSAAPSRMIRCYSSWFPASQTIMTSAFAHCRPQSTVGRRYLNGKDGLACKSRDNVRLSFSQCALLGDSDISYN